MDKYETDILLMLNESEENINSDYIVLEIQLPEEVGVLDRAKYNALLRDTNDILKGNGKKAQDRDIVNLILDGIKFAVRYLTSVATKTGGNLIIPSNLKVKILDRNNGAPFNLTLNPIGAIIDLVVGQLVSKLFEMAVAPTRVKYMIKSYNEMIDGLEQIKRVSRDPKIAKKCDVQISRINKAIKELQVKIPNKSKPFKEEMNMFSIKEMMEDMERDESQNKIYTESDVIDTLEEAENMCLGYEDDDDFYLEEKCGSKGCYSKKEACKTEGCGSKKEGCKKESSDSEDEDMLDDMDESFLFADCEDDDLDF